MRVADIILDICNDSEAADKLPPLLDPKSGLYGFDYVVHGITTTLIVDEAFAKPSSEQDSIARTAIINTLGSVGLDPDTFEPIGPTPRRIVEIAIHLAEVAKRDSWR